MIIVIVSGVVDVAWTIYQKFASEPHFILTINDILMTFGAFMVVLFAIEIFQNIILYLRDDVIHVKIVLAIALMAIARKVIIPDYDELEPMYVFVIVATDIVYWFVHNPLPSRRVNLWKIRGNPRTASSVHAADAARGIISGPSLSVLFFIRDDSPFGKRQTDHRHCSQVGDSGAGQTHSDTA